MRTPCLKAQGDAPDQCGERPALQADGAWWMHTDYGDDKDRVVIKSDGNHAYVAGDTTRTRPANPADVAIYMLGADHSGRGPSSSDSWLPRADQIEVSDRSQDSSQGRQFVRMSAGTVVTPRGLMLWALDSPPRADSATRWTPHRH